MHKSPFCSVLLLAVLVTALYNPHAHADASEQEAIQAQLSAALASADYAAKKCQNLSINQSKIDSPVKRTGKTIAELKASEDYKDQREVILSMEKGKQAWLICSVLSSAHGGYARGIINEK